MPFATVAASPTRRTPPRSTTSSTRWGPIYTHLLVPAYLPLVPGLTERLAAGASVADVACGTGTALCPYRRCAAAWATSASSRSTPPSSPPSSRSTSCSCQRHPRPGRARHRAAALASRLEDNIGDDGAVRVRREHAHCLTVSLAAGGAGLGTALGQGARRPDSARCRLRSRRHPRRARRSGQRAVRHPTSLTEGLTARNHIEHKRRTVIRAPGSAARRRPRRRPP